MTHIPPKLQPGSTIGVIGPASPMVEERLRNGISYLERRGHRVKLGKSVRQVYGYLAGADRQRADDVNSMFKDPEVQAIFCTRGGYGTPRILDLIDFDLVERNPKILVGYSDITALQLALYKHARLVTFSGPMVAVEMGKGIDKFTETHFWPMLTSNFTSYRFESDEKKPAGFAGGTARGVLLGGNLAMVATLAGTPYFPDLANCILVLEDIGEEPYRLDRNLTHLRQAGVFDKLSGLILGRFTDCEPSTAESLTLEQIIVDITGDLDLPILANLPYGHVDRKYTLPFGVPALVNADENFLEITASPVA